MTGDSFDRDAMVAARQRLAEAIEGERADWHTVEVRPDDIRAVLGSEAWTEARRFPEDYALPDGAGDGLRAALRDVLNDFDRAPTDEYLDEAVRRFRAALATPAAPSDSLDVPDPIRDFVAHRLGLAASAHPDDWRERDPFLAAAVDALAAAPRSET